MNWSKTKFESGDDITVAIQGILRVAVGREAAKWYDFKNETIVTLRVKSSLFEEARWARLPNFLRMQLQKHWGNVKILGYDYTMGHTYFLEKGTYRVLGVDRVIDRINRIKRSRYVENNKRFKAFQNRS